MTDEKTKTENILPSKEPRKAAVYRLADIDIKIGCRYPYSYKLLEPYKAETENFDFEVYPSEEDIVAVDPDSSAPAWYKENLAILKIISNKLIDCYNGFLFHCSSLLYEGGGYAFAAKSGTGKSTHARLLSELLDDKISYINDDKPFVRYFEDEGVFKIYGNPWNGKHDLGANVSAPLKGVVILTRGEKDEVKREKDFFRVLSCLGNQILYLENEAQGEKFLELVSILFEKVPFYLLKCTKNISAAEETYRGVLRGEEQ